METQHQITKDNETNCIQNNFNIMKYVFSHLIYFEKKKSKRMEQILGKSFFVGFRASFDSARVRVAGSQM